jgi:hypothetical protein
LSRCWLPLELKIRTWILWRDRPPPKSKKNLFGA